MLAALPPEGSLVAGAESFITELIEYDSKHAATSLLASISEVSALHMMARKITSAVEWASNFSSIDWWIAERLRELGLADKHVLVAPGRTGEVHIERTSRFVRILEELSTEGRMLCGPDGEMIEPIAQSATSMASFHVLTVPPFDGISPVWHPLVLGHEVAHLRFNAAYIMSWLASTGADCTSDLAREVVSTYQTITTTYRMDEWTDKRVSHSEKMLQNWLIEVACDTVASYIYGDAAKDALALQLGAYSDGAASNTHPDPELRHAIQTVNAIGDLTQFMPAKPHQDPRTQATSVLVELAIPLRERVVEELAEEMGVDADLAAAVAQATEGALAANELPSSSRWPREAILAQASTVASGLVRGLWRQRNELLQGFPASSKQLSDATDRTSQALDGLEFAVRFERSRSEQGIEAAPEQQSPVPNVLWISLDGVRTSEHQNTGVPSYDLRLGRHFVVFQRNEIAQLDALNDELGTSPIQHRVEVGWGDEFVLHPNELVLAVTFESMRLTKDCSAQVLSRSSLGRLGLLSATAVHVQPGYVGCLTLELVNLSSVPLRLSPGQRIAQVVPLPAQGATDGYDGDFQGTGSRPQLPLSKRDWDSRVLAGLRPDGTRESF